MFHVRRSARPRAALVLVLLAAAIAACDASVTGPVALRASATKPVSIEGDTLRCRQGWTIVAGAYVCNEDL